MLRNYITLVTRNFLRYPVYSTITVTGLILGLVSTILIMLWIVDEVSYDHYHPDNEKVYKLMKNFIHTDGKVMTDQWTSGLAAEKLQWQIPEVELTSRVAWSNQKLFNYGEVANYMYGDFADETIFKLLNINLLAGYASHPLPDNNSVAISGKMAQRFFKSENAIGKVLRIDKERDVTVTAVFEDQAENCTESFDFILPFANYLAEMNIDQKDWDGSTWQYTLVKLNNKEDKMTVENKIAVVLKEGEETSLAPPPFLFPMHDWRLRNHFIDGKQEGGRINYVITFGLVAVFILLIACINFVNLSTARSAMRAHEVGIRKVAGASKKTLVTQFIFETMLLAFVAMGISLLFVYAILPTFNLMVEKHLTLSNLGVGFGLGLLLLACFTGFAAGGYPALFLSSLRPAQVLKGNAFTAAGSGNLRMGLVIFQFAISVFVITCAVLLYQQINYLRNKDLGFDHSHTLYLPVNEEIKANYESFRNQLLQYPEIESIGMGAAHPMEINGWSTFDWPGKLANDETYFNIANCDYDYLPTLGFEFLEGRNFSNLYPADSNNFIVTEGVARHLGKANIIGEQFGFEGKRGTIIGIIKDFHNLSIHEEMQPTVFWLGSKEELGMWASIFIRYQPEQLLPVMELVKKSYAGMSPGFPIDIGFVDDVFEAQFRSEKLLAFLSACFTVLAIAISCLGLLGLVSFSAESRKREIGIRKVLGASVTGLVLLLSTKFMRLIGFAILIGGPLAYWLMQRYLMQYPYRVEITLQIIAFPAIALLIISLSIISIQAIKAALGNPVEVLRSE